MTVDERTERLARELCFLLHKDNDAEWECYIELATHVQNLLVEAENKAIDMCIEAVDEGVLINIDDWGKTRKHLTTVMAKELVKKLAQLKQEVEK